MVVHDIEAGALEVEVCIDRDEGIVSNLFLLQRVLVHEHAHHWRIVWCIVFGEVLQVCSKLGLKDFGYAEAQVKVGVERQGREWEYIFVCTSLVGDVVLPIENAKFEVLAQIGADNLYVLAALHGRYVVSNDGGVRSTVQHNSSILEIGEILDVLNAYRDFCSGMRN